MTLLNIEKDIPLSRFCTFGIGGPARYFTEVQSIEEAIQAVSWAKTHQQPFHCLGKGSNSLFDDKGYSGLIILNKISFLKEQQPGLFNVGGGYSFSLLGVQTARKGWSGLEFASGIPASVGGAVFMNAGANGGSTADTLETVEFLDSDGHLQTFNKHTLSFSYRTSPFQAKKGLIVAATFKLKPLSTARQKQLELIEYRKKTQPYAEKSAGCVFRNPPSLSAGQLIELAQLKGVSKGGARVSLKHANFIVNHSNASCQHVLELIEQVQHRVKEQCGITLESEVHYIPYGET